MLIHSSLCAPACSHWPATHQYTVQFSRRKSTQKFLSWEQQPPSLLGQCSFHGHVDAAGHGAGQVSQLTPHGTAEPCTSCQVPEELHALRPQSYHDPQERTESQPWDKPVGLDAFGTQDTPSPNLGENWTGLGSLGCTHTLPTLKLSFSVVSAASDSLEAAPKSCPIPHSVLFLLAAPFVSYHSTFTCGSRGVRPLSFCAWLRHLGALLQACGTACNINTAASAISKAYNAQTFTQLL